jgi:hypothetical protein
MKNPASFPGGVSNYQQKGTSICASPASGASVGYSNLNAAPNRRIRNCRVTRQQHGWCFCLWDCQTPDSRYAAN